MKKGLIILLLIFITDLLLPFGVAAGVMYTCLLFLLVRESKTVILGYAAAATILILIKFFIYYNSETEYFIPINRSLSIVAVWISAIVASKYKLLEEKERFLKEIERKNQESEQFLYITSHDLNEPLRTVIGMSDLLEKSDGNALGDNGRTCLQYIKSSAERMSQMIRSLLDYGKIGQHAEMQPVDCNQLLADVRTDLHQYITETSAIVRSSNLPVVHGLKNELRLLFQNLIVNAIKFRKPGSIAEVSLSASRVSKGWAFAFADNGIGIEPENLEKIFIIFKRLHGKEAYDGTGIGLAHCKKIVQLHKGDIWVSSEPSRGSTFHFTICTN